MRLLALAAALGSLAAALATPAVAAPQATSHATAQQRPAARPAASKPTATTLEQIASGQVRVGARVEFTALYLPRTTIEITAGGKKEYYVLAVRKQGAYVSALAAALDAVAAAERDDLPRLQAALADDKAFPELVETIGRVVDRALSVKLSPGEAIGLRVSGFEPIAAGQDWEAISAAPKAAAPSGTPRALARAPATIAEAAAAIEQMAARRPPDLDTALPSIDGLALTARLDRSQAGAYRKLTQQYNAELMRRRSRLVELTRQDLLLARARTERLARADEQPVVGVVVSRQKGAADAWTRVHGAAPPAFVSEAGRSEDGFARRAFQATDLLLTTFPAGAQVEIGGQPAGVTPLVVPALATGRTAALRLAHTCYKPHDEALGVAPLLSGLRRLDVVLEPGSPDCREPAVAAAPGPGQRWTTKKLPNGVMVSQDGPVEWPSWDGNGSAVPTLILRCAGGEKEAYLFYELGYPKNREADVFVRFDDEPKSKKFWGAPSENGQSIFFTGFWSKGTDGFIKALLEHKKVSLVVKPKKESKVAPELEFDLEGLDAALGDWLRQCPLKK